jgi:hypothetical protein
MDPTEGPGLQSFECEWADIPPGTKARPRPKGRERALSRELTLFQDERGSDMPLTLVPITKCVYICDDVVSDPKSGKVSLLNIWSRIRVPATKTFPFTLKKLSVFVWFRDGLGDMETYIELVSASTGDVVRTSDTFVLNFKNPTDTKYGLYYLEDWVFPEPGFYTVELFCAGQFVDDQIIQVIQ